MKSPARANVATYFSEASGTEELIALWMFVSWTRLLNHTASCKQPPDKVLKSGKKKYLKAYLK
jgi:hypothetical protein